ncbi:MAG: FGGY family carbohydrate kinase, partial [Bacteroidota bacterium]
MQQSYIIALDQGTTSSRALLIDKQGTIVGMQQEEFPQIFRKTFIWDCTISMGLCSTHPGLG